MFQGELAKVHMQSHNIYCIWYVFLLCEINMCLHALVIQTLMFVSFTAKTLHGLHAIVGYVYTSDYHNIRHILEWAISVCNIRLLMLSDCFYKIKDVILRKMIYCHCSRLNIILCKHVYLVCLQYTYLHSCLFTLKSSTSDKEHLKSRCSLPACVSCLSIVSTAHFYPQYIYNKNIFCVW